MTHNWFHYSINEPSDRYDAPRVSVWANDKELSLRFSEKGITLELYEAPDYWDATATWSGTFPEVIKWMEGN